MNPEPYSSKDHDFFPNYTRLRADLAQVCQDALRSLDAPASGAENQTDVPQLHAVHSDQTGVMILVPAEHWRDRESFTSS